MSTTGEGFERAVAITERLRAPGGCPWDREQTFDSIKPYTLEETYEVLEAIEKIGVVSQIVSSENPLPENCRSRRAKCADMLLNSRIR